MPSQYNDLDTMLSGEFLIPSNRDIGAKIPEENADQRCTYLCGNSLGPLNKRSKALLEEELHVWGTRVVKGHFSHPYGREWVNIADTVTPLLAELVGASEKEVACMGTLTANLHLMMAAFYKPTAQRFKILCEDRAFPSDQYAFASQARLHGYDPNEAIIEMRPREGEFTLRESDILDLIAKEGPSISLVIFSGVQYYTGQWFPMKAITTAAKAQGCVCGWDLAHAIGNVPMALHDWDVDFAVWCSYKYLNSGPGGVGGLFLHNKWDNSLLPQYSGWWGHDPATRFDMPPRFSAIPGAQGFQQSNASVLPTVSLLGSLQIFKEVGMMGPLRKRSLQLTSELESRLLKSRFYIPINEVSAQCLSQGDTAQQGQPGFTIITPRDPESRGSQLSLLFLPPNSDVMQKVFNALSAKGIVGDERKPDVIRLTPAPLYNTLGDCERVASCLEDAFECLTKATVS
ncbi:pyridoxal phosphate-dependent transferase [Suillus clintonianus]|uniref:pyridoxal phosphate-dependent transferase n=1 Tax=Suillus clintonianus TaxID=1904413 RepID=UPI001B868EF3|nr:pyridoxal phosphate-dependent transferase [Suillus clintonianus]KAG2157340.1 pyridoxal phosphate-dependent transferase [Suillus clintonianus]